MENSFKQMGVIPPILKALEEMGFVTPTEVQCQAIPHMLNQDDLIVISKTGSGKTAVFGVSLLQMIDPAAPGPQGLILTPTRELAVQVDSDLKKMASHLQHKTTAIYGQHNINVEIQALSHGISLVTGTPGRVFDHIRQGNLKTHNIHFLVLDEADRMLDMGFFDQVLKIIRTLPKNRVTLLFSATIPEEVRKLCRENMKKPVTIEIESPTMTVDTTQQAYYRVSHNEKNTQLNRLLLFEQPESCVIFCNTRYAVDRVQSFLTNRGYACRSLHGDIPQNKRLNTLQQFKRGDFRLLVATDVAARGIHIDDLSLVVNYDVPLEKDGYVHRIGRTGRAGNVGRAVSLVTSDDIMSLYEIEEHIGTLIEEAELPSDDFFREHRDSVEQWKKANALKIRPSHADSDSKTKEGPKKQTSRSRQPGQHSAATHPQQQKRPGGRPPETNKAPKTASPQAKSVPDASRKKPADTSRQINNDHKTPVRAGNIPPVKPAEPIRPPEVKPIPAVTAQPEAVQNKPFLKRVLQRLLKR